LLAIADRLVVLNFGTVMAQGVPRQVMANTEVRRVYMGLEA
jgi:branched-chain amino acid transport system ATP-binding protein